MEPKKWPKAADSPLLFSSKGESFTLVITTFLIFTYSDVMRNWKYLHLYETWYLNDFKVVESESEFNIITLFIAAHEFSCNVTVPSPESYSWILFSTFSFRWSPILFIIPRSSREIGDGTRKATIQKYVFERIRVLGAGISFQEFSFTIQIRLSSPVFPVIHLTTRPC